MSLSWGKIKSLQASVVWGEQFYSRALQLQLQMKANQIFSFLKYDSVDLFI